MYCCRSMAFEYDVERRCFNFDRLELIPGCCMVLGTAFIERGQTSTVDGVKNSSGSLFRTHGKPEVNITGALVLHLPQIEGVRLYIDTGPAAFIKRHSDG